MSKIIEEQLKHVLDADLSNYNEQTKTYFIPKKVTIKIELDKGYLIHLKPQAFNNDAVISNWNGGMKPLYGYLNIEVTHRNMDMIKVAGVGAQSLSELAAGGHFWSGWLNVSDVDILKQL